MLSGECISRYDSNLLHFHKILCGNENPTFLVKHPSEWPADNEYPKMGDIVHNLAVVNDAAERAIGLMKQFNNRLTISQDGHNDVLQSVENFRRKTPKYKKKTICNVMNDE